MIRIKGSINKAKTLRELEEKAEDIYQHSWGREIQIKAFINGAKYLIEMLREENKPQSNIKGPESIKTI